MGDNACGRRKGLHPLVSGPAPRLALPATATAIIESDVMSSDMRLAPGSRQVDAFGPDECYERDENGEAIEEISYITLDLGPAEPIVPSSSTYRLIVRGHMFHTPEDLCPRRVWIRRPHSFNSLGQIFRVHTTHCSGLSSSSLRTKVSPIHSRICMARHHSYLAYQTSTTKQDVKYPISPTHPNVFVSNKSKSGRKMYP